MGSQHFLPHLKSTAERSRKTLVLWSWDALQKYDLTPSTSTKSTTTSNTSCKTSRSRLPDRECKSNSQNFHLALISEWIFASQKETFEMVRTKSWLYSMIGILKNRKLSLAQSSLTYNGTRGCDNTPYYVGDYVIGIYDQCTNTITQWSLWPYSEFKFK